MLARPEGPDPPCEPWTGADVERWLTTAFQAMPYTSIYAPRDNTLTSADHRRPSATSDNMAFTGAALIAGIEK